MVKESEQKKAYHPRAAHKEGCLCGVCKSKRVKLAIVEPEVVAEPEIIVPPPPAKVRLGTLNTRDLFELNGQRYRVGEVTGELSVCALLIFRNNGPDPADQSWALVKTVSMGKATMVQPVK